MALRFKTGISFIASKTPNSRGLTAGSSTMEQGWVPRSSRGNSVFSADSSASSGWCLLGVLLIVRLFAMWAIPLNDTTEARYGEMARKMLVTHDWITLWHDIGVPFWGKPPLAIWLSAFAMKLFGVSAFVVRLPSLCVQIGLLWLLYRFVHCYRDRTEAWLTVLILASSILFYLAAGAMMMDAILLFGVTLSQIAFWSALKEQRMCMGYLFFIGLSIGLLAKGPIALILVGGTLLPWIVWQGQWRAAWQSLPWFLGSALMLLLVLPWYYLAERKTPGFLQYFIMGEHFGRFFQSAWQGDKYGFAHAHGYGTIWLYAILASFPWCAIIGWGCYRYRLTRYWSTLPVGWWQYWLTAALFPLCFFTIARNIIYPYALPCLPAFAILGAQIVRQCPISVRLVRVGVGLVSVGMLCFSVLFLTLPQWVGSSQNRMVLLWQAQASDRQNPLVYWGPASSYYSASFYAEGHTLTFNRIQRFCAPPIDLTHPLFLVWPAENGSLPPDQLQVQVIGKVQTGRRADWLLKILKLPGGCP